MTYLLILLLSMIALGNGNIWEKIETFGKNYCSKHKMEERSDDCMEEYFTALSEDYKDYKTCTIRNAAENCIKKVFDDCPDEETKSKVDEIFGHMEDPTEGIDCSKFGEKEIAEACVEDNINYFMDCVTENELRDLGLIGIDPNLAEIDPYEKWYRGRGPLKCKAASVIADCITKRVEENCGKTARDTIQKQLSDLPQHIKKSCDPVDVLEYYREEKKKEM